MLELKKNGLLEELFIYIEFEIGNHHRLNSERETKYDADNRPLQHRWTGFVRTKRKENRKDLKHLIRSIEFYLNPDENFQKKQAPIISYPNDIS